MKQAAAIILLALVIALQCKETPPEPPSTPSISLTVIDTGVTDLTFRLHLTVLRNPQKIALLRDGKPIVTTTVASLDTILTDDSLEPKHNYSYVAYRYWNEDAVADRTVGLTVTTMDTTSHEFTWQIDTLGDGNSSLLNDVAIINDTLVYAVGEIYKKDSTGQIDPLPYNLAEWNGRGWALERVTVLFRGFTITPPLKGIFAFSPSQIWLAGGLAIHGDGEQWTPYDVRLITGFDSLSFTKCWGANPSQMYFVGLRGSPASYDGSTWRKMESGTSVDLLDVWGSPDGGVVWACGWVDFMPSVLLRFSGGRWEKVYEDPSPFTIRQDSLSGILTSVWTTRAPKIFAASPYGLYKCDEDTRGAGSRFSFTPEYLPGFPFRLRGHDIYDLFVVGEYYMIAHYNGVTFKYFSQFYGQGRLRSVDQRNNLIVAVGHTFDPINSKAVVFIGRR